jgi:1,2-diacylglycerol 3-alpha-glucosyltransferase
MNIGIFTDTYYPEINGVANSAYELKKGLESLGHQVYIFTVTNPSVTEEEPNVFRIRSLPFVFLKERRVGCTLAAMWKKKIRQLDLDIIHTQTEFSIGHLGRKTAMSLGIAHIHTYHTIYEEYTHYLMLPDNEAVKEMARIFSRHCCNQADAVIVPTKKVERLLKEYGVRRKISTIPTGIPLEKFRDYNKEHTRKLMDDYHLKKEHRILIYIGRLSEEKNVDALIYQFHMIADQDPLARLVIVGDGPEKEKLEDDVRTWQLEEKVVFTGMADWSIIQDYYAMGDVFVSMSNSETQGLTYLEALAAGKPILVKKDECLKNVLFQEENGYAFSNSKEFFQGYEYLFGEAFQKTKEEICSSIVDYTELSFASNILDVYREAGREEYGADEKINMVDTA